MTFLGCSRDWAGDETPPAQTEAAQMWWNFIDPCRENRLILVAVCGNRDRKMNIRYSQAINKWNPSIFWPFKNSDSERTPLQLRHGSWFCAFNLKGDSVASGFQSVSLSELVVRSVYSPLPAVSLSGVSVVVRALSWENLVLWEFLWASSAGQNVFLLQHDGLAGSQETPQPCE